MPKTTHQHQEDALVTDKKFRPDDEHIYQHDKQEFQESEIEKKEAAPKGEGSKGEPKNEK
jgi:hypothetical protein